ncbi:MULTISPECIES: DUF1565 domain-containing protein [Sorangium]|uniref:PGRS family protein n=1 Tax=Sorangium cellulosum TaxID=56 RepID=A0A4P2QYY7_SORCE|nr:MULTISPECIES: DUF1565 domain-containing protein [Sorangium]AUX35797.1 hypothetical protein SOCE836_079960 [Sorangium cellulosum]WCQ95094.1 hypothetical protein NQZ70_07869 [Sorangium sp. Soce836]
MSSLTACAYTDLCSEVAGCAPEPEPPPGPCAGEPGTAPALDQCGVFVSAWGDDSSPGTKDAPVKTLQHAIGLAASGRDNGEAPTRRVYACSGSFEEAITLRSGVDLWGGRRCDEGGDWSYEGSFGGPDHPTIIAPPVGIPLRVIAGEQADATSTVFGVRALAADASAIDGKSSIAMMLSPGARAIVRASAIIAGNGKDGDPGQDAPSVRAKDGVLGNDGADACTSDSPAGALPVVTVCDDGIESTGGYGGDGGLEQGGDGASGQPAPVENDDDGGHAGSGAGSSPCKDGKPGKGGLDAGRARGAVGAGYLTEDGWMGIRGEDGKKGGVGQGGGGGGGSRSRGTMVACPAGRPQAGAAGGSGGSGGCGGQGGQGGGYGGSSIGVVALQGSAVTLEATRVTTGNGGNGGAGGTGQPGGVGRRGGDSGKGFGPEMWDACRGGTGGDGGRGGDAGGGLGGSSYGIAAHSAYVTFGPDVPVQLGRHGAGGLAGSAASGDEVGMGQEGDSMPYRQFDVPNPAPPR